MKLKANVSMRRRRVHGTATCRSMSPTRRSCALLVCYGHASRMCAQLHAFLPIKIPLSKWALNSLFSQGDYAIRVAQTQGTGAYQIEVENYGSLAVWHLVHMFSIQMLAHRLRAVAAKFCQ
eukprot:SAG31_NODE_2024_length_6644_cov_7.943621_8_plen_121_part_00